MRNRMNLRDSAHRVKDGSAGRQVRLWYYARFFVDTISASDDVLLTVTDANGVAEVGVAAREHQPRRSALLS